ncbi:MAG: twin-arginine translocase subunit TatC [Wenzhouxiangellaceae bacterium]|nr:twin-arginine translocase subunit TatC [Wenzhouxiangellaceae bacterium]
MTPADPADPELTLIDHLLELRTRLVRSVVAIAVIMIALMPFARRLYSIVSEPLVAQLPAGASMIAIDVVSPVFAPFKLVMILAILLAMPYVIYQVWAFVAPGLYQHEKRLARPLLVAATLLFYLGCLFAYFVVMPVIFGFVTKIAPDGVAVMTDINRYLDFILLLFLAFGFSFEVPVITVVLVAIGVVTPEGLTRARGYVVVGVFFIAMLITPPDMISQTLLALPVWGLYELGIVFSRMVRRQRSAAEARPSSGTDPADG